MGSHLSAPRPAFVGFAIGSLALACLASLASGHDAFAGATLVALTSMVVGLSPRTR